MLKTLLIIFFTLISQIISQPDQQSEAYKKTGFSRHSPLLKPKYPSYSLAANFVLTEKAKKGDPFAQHELGIRYILGIGVPADTLNAAYWIGKAAERNLPAANFNYGIMLHGGIGVDWNPFEAFKNFKIAAESGMEQAQYIIGLMYTDNLIVNRNIQSAINWLVKAAEKDFEDAKNVLKEFEKKGIYTPNSSEDIGTDQNNLKKSENIYTSFVSSEYQLDYYNFGEDSLTETEERTKLNEILSSKGEELKKILNIDENVEKIATEDTSAIGLINFAASSGSPEALLIKGRLLEYGLGIRQDLISASGNYLKAFRLGSYKAAESLLKISQRKDFFPSLEEQVKKNNADAMYVWAGLIALGLDYSLTQKQAFELLTKAKEQKHISSIIELGLAYYSGSLVEKDSIKAINLFELASDLGSTEAEIRLAYIKMQEDNSIKKSKYLSTLVQNSDRGSVLAQAALANCYEKGIGVSKNKGKAASLYRQAAQRGNEAALNSLRNMYDEIRPSDEEFIIFL